MRLVSKLILAYNTHSVSSSSPGVQLTHTFMSKGWHSRGGTQRGRIHILSSTQAQA